VWHIPNADERVGVQVNWDPLRTGAVYVSDSEVVFHEEALYQVYAPLPLPRVEAEASLSRRAWFFCAQTEKNAVQGVAVTVFGYREPVGYSIFTARRCASAGVCPFSVRHTYYVSAHNRRGIKRWCCLTSAWSLSVWRLSVAYIGPKSRTERPRSTKIGTEVAHVTRDSDTTFKVKRSKVKVTRPLYSARP